jgi:hypothetical protein
MELGEYHETELQKMLELHGKCFLENRIAILAAIPFRKQILLL